MLVVTPADQTVANALAFTTAMQRAVEEAANGTIVILGVTPDKPETGYGYIQVNQAEANAGVHAIPRFVEKRDANTAQTYLNEGGYYWNAGMFVLKASVWLNALDQFRPDILHATQAAWDKRSADNKFVRPGKAEFSAIPSESVDYAAMEHCPGKEIEHYLSKKSLNFRATLDKVDAYRRPYRYLNTPRAEHLPEQPPPKHSRYPKHWFLPLQAGRLIALRRAEPALVDGRCTLLMANDRQIFAYLRSTAASRILVVTNLSARPARFVHAGLRVCHADLLLANLPVAHHPDGDMLRLAPYEARVYRVQA